MQQHSSECKFNSSNSWVILSPIEQSIKEKIEAIGIPLKDWNIQINYGIKTGLNEAFIISTEKRNEILAACLSEEERQKTDALIRPILRGRDIKKYSYEWDDWWLIATFPSRKYNIDEYPAVKQYLLSCGKARLMQSGDKGSRKKTNNRWFETQDSISYWEDFLKPKIVWGNLNLQASFSLAPEGMFVNAPCPMIVPANNYLLAVLNSKLGDYYIRKLGVTRNGGYFEYKPMFIEQLPVPLGIDEEIFSKLIENENYEQIEQRIYELYKLSEDEIHYIESCN